jgi:uncharacterized protein DUF6074
MAAAADAAAEPRSPQASKTKQQIGSAMSASPQKSRYERSSKIVPFPQIRRRRFVMLHAIRLAHLPHKTAGKLLAATLRQQAEAMARKGIPAAVIERESRNLESAIRAELWRHVILRPDDGIA